jgi:cobalt/nickel transport system ATP-binding protein
MTQAPFLDPLIYDLRGVEYIYGGTHRALQSVSLRVKAGERIAILGSNGSGKSTLLQILDGLLFPTAGEARAFGQKLSEEKFREASFTAFFRKRVGLLFQSPDIQLFCPTVLDEIAFGPLQLDLPREEVFQKCQEMIRMLNLEKVSPRSPHRLSGGEKKKVALASVLALNPDVLLLDEPTSGLDPRTQVWLIEVLEELHSLGKTIITATHDLSILEEIADRAYVMAEDHVLVADGPPEEILDDLDLLLRVNLIHEHAHEHEGFIHRHGHLHALPHRHDHPDQH